MTGAIINPKISVHEVCFPEDMDVDAILKWAEQHGIDYIGLLSLRRGGDWASAIASVAASSVAVAYLCHASMFQLDDPDSWSASTARIMATIDAAKAMGTPIVYATTGPAGKLEFEEAMEALACAIIPAREYAHRMGIELLIETTSPLFCFTHFVHTFEDTVAVASQAGIGICLDLSPTWHERGIRAKIAATGKQIAMVQVSDHIPRNMSASRDVIGQGIIPVERLLRCLFETGYDGIVDLELFGRPEESALDDILLSLCALSAILDRLRLQEEPALN